MKGLDLREVESSKWSNCVTDLLGVLEEGESVILTSAMDPKDVLEEAASRLSETLKVRYLEQGAELWKTKVVKGGRASSGGCCGGCCGA